MTKSTITREQLIKKAQEQIEFCRHTKITGEGRAHVNQCAALFEIALSAMDGEPVAWAWHYREQWHVTNDERRAEFVAKDGDVAVLPLYRHAQAAPVVPDEKDKTVDADDHPLLWSFNEGWNACRAAMLKAQPQNAPQNIPEIIPDGWIPVSEHLPKEKGVYQVWNGKYVDNVPFWFGSFQSLHSELITHWMPLPAAPQEVKP
ncbi:DUF551 domain-containing protein [Klebsiella pneumoniae]